MACRELFGILHNATFLENPRYVALYLVPSAEDANFAEALRDSFKGAVPVSNPATEAGQVETLCSLFRATSST